MEGIFGKDGIATEIELKEYIKDLMLCKDKAKAIENSISVKAKDNNYLQILGCCSII